MQAKYAATFEADIQATLKLGFSLYRRITTTSSILPGGTRTIFHLQHYQLSALTGYWLVDCDAARLPTFRIFNAEEKRYQL